MNTFNKVSKKGSIDFSKKYYQAICGNGFCKNTIKEKQRLIIWRGRIINYLIK